MKVRSILAIVALSFGAAAFAQTAAPAGAVKDPLATPNIDKRQANQEKRIEQGVASGQLTSREQQRLEGREAAIAKAEDKAKADGVVTGKERARLHKMENHAGKSIRHQKHDGQRDLNHDGKRDRKAVGQS